MVTAASHTPAGIRVRLPTFVVAFVVLAAFAFAHSATACGHSDPAGGSCSQCGVAATLAALLVASFVFVPLCAVLLEFAGILNLNGCDASEMLYLLEGFCVFAGVYWCVDGDFTIFCSCGSCMWSAASSCSLCAYVGCFFSLEGMLFWLDGILAFAFVALFLVGVYFVCCRGSSCNDGVPRSSIIALVGDFIFSILSSLILRGLWVLSLAGCPKKAKYYISKGTSRSLFLQVSGSVTANIDDPLVKGSGEHGIVSSLPEGLGQASGRVDVLDDAKIPAAAAIEGTLRSGPGSLDALGLARSRESKIQFCLKGYDGCTRVIKCQDCDLMHDVVEYGGWDIHATLHGHILDLSGTLLSQGVSDNDTIRISCRLRGGSNNTDIPGQWQCANCDATRCWPVRRNCYRCGARHPDTPPTLAPWNIGKSRGRSKGPLGRDPLPGPSNVPPTVREPRVVPPRGPPGAGVGTPPGDAESSAFPGDLLGALKLLQTVMSAEE